MSLGCAFAATSLSATARVLRAVRPGVAQFTRKASVTRTIKSTSRVSTMASLAENPLASWTYGLGEKAGAAPDLPKWSSITAEHVRPAITAAVEAANAEIDAIEAKLTETPATSWEEIMDPLERLSEKLSRPWGVVSHLKGVRDSDELRAAYDDCQPDVVTASLRIGQSRPVYDALVALTENADTWAKLTSAQQRAVECEVRDAKLSGVALDGADKDRYNEIAKELSALSTEFSNNVLDATKAFEHLCTDKSEVVGLPKSALEQAAQTAQTRGKLADATAEDGPWMFTLDAPSYMAVRSHAENRALREKVYRAYLARASAFFAQYAADSKEDGKKPLGDNAPLIEQILTLRQEKAKLLGYENFAEVSMAKKMATLTSAESLLEDIRAKSKPAAVRELAAIREFAKEKGAAEAETGLMQWDVGFWAERLREAKYELKEEDLRPYFQLPAVIDGMFDLAGTLFGIKVEPADGAVEVWHPDVRFFKVLDVDTNEPRAYFYLDPYTRPAEKRGGAWMDDVVGRSAAMAAPGSSVRLPTAHMVCNGTPPIGNKPSLMTHNEVTTLFHEFGHALQHMLTTEDVGPVAGINQVDWDAVELPSQFMENFCYDKKVLQSIGKHHETGEPLPDELFDKLVASKNFGSGTRYLRQCHFAMTDLELHARYTPGKGSDFVFATEKKISEKTQLMPAIEEDRFLCGFGHIFAGGYSAGYYSYLWAEVLSADAFGAFEEAGLDDDAAVKATGGKFANTVLALGGGAAPMEVFKKFRGREPSVEALLRHNGLVVVSA